MRRPALAVSLFVTIVVPQARAQGTSADAARGGSAVVTSLGFVPFPLPSNPALEPGGRLGPPTSPALVAAIWEYHLRSLLPDPRMLRTSDWVAGMVASQRGALAPPTFSAINQSGILGPYADIGMQLNVRFEVKADQFRNLACTPLQLQTPLSGCQAKFPTITPSPQYAIRSSGVIGQRLHVNVDFDSQREFDANNTIQVWYEGLPDEILRRVEVGNVSFAVPNSQFISAAIPANNFGFQAIAQIGNLQMRGIYAQQKGTVVKDRIYTVGQVTSQSVARDGRDLDFEKGRFFFAVDPALIPGFPAVDILNLNTSVLPADLRVGALHVYRMRAVSTTSSTNTNIGGVRAVACGPGANRAVQCSAGANLERAGPFQWEVLQEGKDYYVDPSGAWFALASTIDQSDYLAVSYVPLSGVDTVGTFPVLASDDTSRIDTLRLVYDPNPIVTAASPSFRFEIRSAYRFGGNDLTRETAQFSVTVNQRTNALNSSQTYLQRLGLALANNPAAFDQYNRLFPRTRDPQQGAPLRDYYVIFPNLRPFADSTKLAPSERNDSLYRTPRGLLATQGPPSVFALHYLASSVASADRSTLSLNSFQIRDGSEKIFVAGQQLTRGTDYTIDYTTGTVQFLHPDSLFQNGISQVRAQFEERTGFAVAPTAIYGMAGEYDLGTTGRVNLTGLFQSQQSPFTRPPLGSEPSSSFIGGVSTELRFQPTWLTDAVSAIPGMHGEAPSFIRFNGEVALSKPSPNSAGQAYLEEFEGETGRFISLSDASWQWGSVPTSTRGAEPFGFTGTFDPVSFSGGFDPRFAAFMTWQSLPVNADGTLVQFFPQQIDPTIVLSGATQTPEPVLWITLKPDTVLGLAHNGPTDSLIGTANWVRPSTFGPRWRSITQTLSPTGIDLSRTEYLEFWVWEDNRRTARANHTAILFDFGSVFEDALAFVPDSFTVSAAGDTTYHGQRATGRGTLQTERDPLTHSWNAAINDEGILSDRVTDGIVNGTKGQTIDTLPLCDARVNGVVAQYAFGDLRSRCGRHNGAVDTEDQDGDFQLDSVVGVKTHEDFVRFVFPIGSDQYYVRDGGAVPVAASQGGGTAGWRLYRIPFHTDTIAQGEPNLRQIQSLRITVVAPQVGAPGTPQPQVFFALSRVQLVGASWLKRADTPIPGIAGETGVPGGEVIASIVSTENRDLGYTSPPGVVDEASKAGASLQVGSTQINETSLRLLASGLQKGQHAEAFNRFTTEGDKNLLKYRALRVWARGRGPGWEDGDLEFYIKVGKDENNFYMYHVPARTSSWEPEVVAQFDPWLLLRARIEQAWLRGDPPQIYPGCPDTSIVPFDSSYVMCNGPYLVHVHDPATAPPNLAAVEELAAGILRVNNRVYINQAELWVDDIRVSDVVQDVGMAGALDLAITASSLADLSFSVSRREANFQQLGEDPTYSTDNVMSAGGTFHLERLLPPDWGLAMPLGLQYSATSSDPFYLQGTDIRADALEGLRTPLSSAYTVTLGLHRVRRAASALGRYVLDPVSANFSYTTASARTSLSNASASSFSYAINYVLSPGATLIRFVPGFLVDLSKHLPHFLLNGPFFRDLEDAQIRVNPASIQFSSSYTGGQSSQLSFQVPVREASDALITPAASYNRNWRNSGGLALSPFRSLQMRVDVSSIRDLRNYGDSTSVGRLLQQQRQTLFGHDIGVETQRSLNGYISLTPDLGDWIRPRASFTTGFNLSRDPNAPDALRDPVDSSYRLPLAFANSQRLDAGTQFDPGRLARGIFGDSSEVTRWIRRLASIDLAYSRTRQSNFGQVADLPTTSYELGFGNLTDFREQGGALAVSAIENSSFTASGSANLPLGFRANTSYQSTDGVTWVLRTDAQTPLQVRTLDWPAGGLSWTLSPSSGGLGLGKLITSITAQVNYRRHEAESQQPSLGGDNSQTSVTQSTDRSVAPSLTLSWIHGVLTSADATVDRSEAVNAGSLYRTTNSGQNFYVAFAFRPPRSLIRLPTDVRTNMRYSTSTSLTCLQPAGQTVCVPYVDTRLRQTQLSMDTNFPPTFSAGLQVAYNISEEFQLNQKTAQLTITAYVSLSTSVGQFR